MKRSYLICGLCATAAAPPLLLLGTQPARGDEAVQWSYSGASGPANWGSLEPAYKECAIGLQQSPIDITSPVVAQIGSLSTDYKAVPMKIVNNGHSIQVNYAPGSTLTIRERSYVVQQFHFHTPSEHTINGEHFQLEMHIVHKDGGGNLAVLGVLFEQGPANPALDQVFNQAPATAGPEQSTGITFNVASLVPSTIAYYEYLGSLTTPPCTEGVKWMVLAARNTLSAAQLAKFQSIFPANARPIQSLEQRFVLENA